MRYSYKLLTLAALLAIGCTGCTHISLSKSGGSAPGGGSNSGGGGLSFNIFGNQPDQLTGDWTITFVTSGQEHSSTVSFKQQGHNLSGDGKDEDGKPFMINGTVDGAHVHFLKKYVEVDPSKQPVDYSGELTKEDDAEYKGWTVGGYYKASINGQPVEDKWVAINMASVKTAAQPPAQPAQPAQPEQAAQPEENSGATDGGEQQAQEPAKTISGMYTVHYDCNFKNIETRLWLHQLENNVITGDGYDVTTDEHFIIQKGSYHPPYLYLKCHYEKGKHAHAARDLIVHANVGPGPSFHGETQPGSRWNAVYVTK